MKIKTTGKCTKCNEALGPAKVSAHLLECTLQSLQSSRTMREGYLIRISCALRPETYWMFAVAAKDASLGLLDRFLRDTWLECCGHLSEFTIGGRALFSRTEAGHVSRSMKKPLQQFLSPGLKCGYVYDMGSSTDLELEVIAVVAARPEKKVTLVMQNEPPVLPCESCKKIADAICSLCGKTTCPTCAKRHACVIREEDDYMLMPLVNSPRAGVCGYVGASSGEEVDEYQK